MEDLLVKQANIYKIVFDDNQESLVILLENKEKEILIISSEVKIYDNKSYSQTDITEIKVGQKIYVYYNKHTPMMMSLPAKYVPELIVVEKNENYVDHVYDYFNEDLISSDGRIKVNESLLHLVESTCGKSVLKEILAKQKLLIFYQKTTKSIPAIVDPKKIVIVN